MASAFLAKQSCRTLSLLDLPENEDFVVVSTRASISIALDNQNQHHRARTENQRDRQPTSKSRVTQAQDPTNLSSDTMAQLYLPDNEDFFVVSKKPIISIIDDNFISRDLLGTCQAAMFEGGDLDKFSRETLSAFVLPPHDVSTQSIISLNEGEPTPTAPHSSESTILDDQDLAKVAWDKVSPLVLPENEDIQVVSKKPVISIHRKRRRHAQTRPGSTLNHVATVQIAVFLSIPIFLLLLLRKRKQPRKSQYNDNHTQHVAADTATISEKPAMPSSNPGSGARTPTEDQPGAVDLTLKVKMRNLSIGDSYEHAHLETRQPAQPYIQEPSQCNVHHSEQSFEPRLLPSTASSTPQWHEIDDKNHNQPTSSTHVAGAIRLLHDIVQEKGIDSALAQHMTIALHSSQQLLLAQEQVKLQAVLLETHHKLIMEQREATLCYDPNWKDKLRDRRDKCWNAACRLIWDVAVAHVLAKVTKPLLPLLVSNRPEGYMSSTTRILQVLVDSICDCSSSPSTLDDSTSSSSWFFYSTFSTDIFSSILSWDSYLLLGQGACYGHCLLSLGIVSMITLVAHQVLRAFSFPVLFHHVMNAFAISILLGGLSPMDWISQIRPQLLIVALSGVIGLLMTVEWKYQSRYKALVKSTPSTFRIVWEQSIDTMDTLQFQVSLTRFIAFAILGTMLWLQILDEKENLEKSRSVAVITV